MDTLQRQLQGATASATALVWAQHNGRWVMKRPLSAELPDPFRHEFSLFSHLEAFNLAAGPDPSAQIPAQPQTSTDPGPPFSFLGPGHARRLDIVRRPVVAEPRWTLTGLAEAQVSIGCIGLVAQGAVSPSTIQIATVSAQIFMGSPAS